MSNKNSRFTHDDIVHLAKSIENLKNENDYKTILEILLSDPTISQDNYTLNSNGVFFNLSKISNETFRKIRHCLKKINKQKNNEIVMDTDIIPNFSCNKTDRTHKLTNYEKNILKQRNLKKILNNDPDYEELRISATENDSDSCKSVNRDVEKRRTSKKSGSKTCRTKTNTKTKTKTSSSRTKNNKSKSGSKITRSSKSSNSDQNIYRNQTANYR